MRPILLSLALVAPIASAQLPVADLRASHVVLTEVPTLRFFDWPPLTPDYPQVVRLRIENRGPADAPDVGLSSFFGGFMRPDLVHIAVEPGCGLNLSTGSSFTLSWPIGLLRAGEARECTLTLRATGAGPPNPPPNGGAWFLLRPTSGSVQSPIGQFSATERLFTIAPSVAILADYAVRFEPSTVRIDPGAFRDVSLYITNRGPQAVTPAQTRLFGWLDAYNRFGPPPAPTDPFVIDPFELPGCRFQQVGPIPSPPSFVELTAIVETIAPGETRECRLRVSARPDASGERTIRFTQRVFFDGVVDPDLSNNLASLRMIFGEPPAVPVPATGHAALAVLMLLVMLLAAAWLAQPAR